MENPVENVKNSAAAGLPERKGGQTVLFGEHSCNIDEKNRLSIPARFREELGEEFIITRWLDKCLIVLPKTKLDYIEQSLMNKGMVEGRDVSLFLYSGLAVVTPDKLGRVVLTAPLRKHARLVKEAVVIGVGAYAEIWDPEEWERKQEEDLSGLPIRESMKELNF